MCSIMSASGGQKPQFWANFDFGWLLYPPPLTDEGQIWCARVDPRSTLTRQISPEAFTVSASGGQKAQFWANFDFRGLLYRPPFTNEGQIWCYSDLIKIKKYKKSI